MMSTTISWPWVGLAHHSLGPLDHMMDTSSSSPEISRLESQIQALSDLSTRLQQLRNVPAWLNRSPNSMMPMEPIREQFENLRQLGNNLSSDHVQEALKAARESEKDKSEMTLKYRRDTNKAKLRTPSPDSPRYYESSLTKVSVPFPTLVGDLVPLTLAGLPDYIRNFNKASAPSKLNIWVPTRAEMGKLRDPVTVRLVLPDILVAYCLLSTPASRSGLAVETVTVSGPREQTKPHTQSEYTVYQKVSQQIVKMVQIHPQVSFQQLMNLLLSYENLFVTSCSICSRVLSLEAHIPPVARLWIEGEGGGRWDSRHITCLQV